MLLAVLPGVSGGSGSPNLTQAIELSKQATDEAMEKDPKARTILQFSYYNFSLISWPSKKIYQQNEENVQNKAS